MFLKFVKSKSKTYVYLMEYLPVEKRDDEKYTDREVVERLGDLNRALVELEIWKRHPHKIPGKLINFIEKDDIKRWIYEIVEKH